MTLKEPTKMAKLLSEYEGLWMIAGGWAIDLFLNQNTRPHQDIEIAIPRREQFKLKSYLKEWHFRYVVSGQFYDWSDDMYLELPIHELHGTNPNGDTLEVLFNEINDTTWAFRRNLKITYPLEKVIYQSLSGIPILAPELVLLYKAKWVKEKDMHDFKHALPQLNSEQKAWLKNAIQTNHGEHEWLKWI